MSKKRQILAENFPSVISLSAAQIRKTSPLSIEVVHG
jgi:hypothetical protein